MTRIPAVRLARTVCSAVLLAPVVVYRRLVSPLLPNRCRYVPSCSSYASTALRTHGPIRGSALTVWRLLRCNPWSAGGFDPVPGTPSQDPRLRGGQIHAGASADTRHNL